MSILLNPVQRVNPRDAKAPKMWYPVQHVTQQLDENAVAKFISDETTLNEGEALMAIRQLHKVVLRALLNGQSVKLGDLGYIGLTLNSSGVVDKKKLSARQIKRVNPNFQPSDAFKAELQKADFVWIDKIIAGQDTAAGGGSDAGGGSGGNTGGGDDGPGIWG
jgi:predicted histone-like DNA-binding protein